MSSLGKWLRNILLGLVIVAFVLIFGQPGGGEDGAGAIAEVRGQSISREVFEFFRELKQNELREAIAAYDAEQIAMILDTQARDTVIRRAVLSQEAQALGLRVPDSALRAEVQSSPGFQRDGRYDRELAERLVEQTGLGTREFMEQQRIDMLIRDFSQLVESTVRVSDVAVREQILRAKTSLKVQYAAAEAREYAARAKVSQEEAAALVSKQPERVRAAYESGLTEFKRAEEIQARHILFTGEGAMERGVATKAWLAAGQDFDKLARELSQDPATRERGGDLGRFPRGRMLEGFDEVAFGLEVGQVSEPVQTERGVHLIKLEKRYEAVEQPFESVAPQLARGLLTEERSGVLAREAIERVIKSASAGKSLAAACAAEGLKLQSSPEFALEGRRVPGLDRVGGAFEAAVALSKQHAVAPEPLVKDDVYYALALLERKEPGEEEIQALMSSTRDGLANLGRVLTSGLWYEQRKQQLEQDGEIQLFALGRQ